MTITVKFFASLSEQLGKSEAVLVLPSDTKLSVREVWSRATDNAEMPNKLLMAVNMEYAKPEAMVKDNDEVAFFPPVTGG